MILDGFISGCYTNNKCLWLQWYKYFHLSPNENICSITRMKKKSLFVLYNSWINLFRDQKQTKQKKKMTSLQPQEIVDSSCMACIQRARYMNLLYTLTTALRHDTHLATAYFSTKKGNIAIVQNAWDQKCMVNGTKLHGRWQLSLNRANN